MSQADQAGATRDLPEAYIPRDRRWAFGAGRTMPDRVSGAALFADISGFTPLTEALATELGPQRGAEELTATLGRVFHAVIAELDAYDGNVIYFSGDAITCWLDGDDGTLACAAALGMQEAMERTGTITTPAGTSVTLAMKIAVAVGSARRFLVGDPDIQLIDVLAGRLVDDLAEAEHHAQKGQIVLDESAIASLGDRIMLRDRRVDEASGREIAVLVDLLVDVEQVPAFEPPPLPEELVRPWLLPAVYERLRAGRGEFLAELRPAIPVFVRFTGIDYDADDDAIPKLDEFVRASQHVFAAYGGNLLQLTLGDKGAYLYGVFGSPIAHEDDAARAAAAALEIRELERSTAAREIQVGLAHGRLRSGTYGHRKRRTFVCLGDAVNLAARLMGAAPQGRIYVADPVRQAAGDGFIWERLPDLMVKGKSAPIAAWSLEGSLERASRRKTRYELRLVGRKAELAALDERLAAAVEGRGRVLGIAAEAGMGKSRLIAEFVRSARRRGVVVAFGECQAYGSNSAYFAWREIWRRLLRLDDDDPEAAQRARLERELAAIDPALLARMPLLEAVVGLTIPDNDLTSSFDAKLRKGSLEALLVDCLRARSGMEPVVIVIEDAHWIDELSRDLLEVLVRAAAGLRVLFVLAYRPAAESGGGLGLGRQAHLDEIALDRLDDADASAVVRSKLEQLLGADADATDELVALVTARADGNPFYVEELVSFIASSGIDTSDGAALRNLQLPESLHSLVLSRIDTVAEEPRRTLKVASVIGRVFRAPVLPGAYPELGTLDDVRDHLETLRTRDLVIPERVEDLSFLFKHVVTQEVAYASMPFAQRRALHRAVGLYLEAQDHEPVEQRLDLLAHHFWLADDEVRKREYLARAGAAAQASYANAAAIDYYDRLVPLLEGKARVEAQLKLEQVLELVGDWTRAVSVAEEALHAAETLDDADAQGWARAALADLARKQGRFDDSALQLAEAAAVFQVSDDEAGLAQVWHLAGTVAAMRGELDLARRRYQESLAIRERLGDRAKIGALYSNLAIVAEYEGDLAEAQRLSELAYGIRVDAGDRWGVGVSLHNLGVYATRLGRPDEARAHVEEALRIMLEVGDTWFAATERMLLGNMARDAGDLDEARANYAASIPIYLAVDDPVAQAEFLEDVGLLASRMGAHERAIELVEAATALREEIGATETPAAIEEFRVRLGASLGALDEPALDRAKARGRSLGAGGAIGVALELCSPAGWS